MSSFPFPLRRSACFGRLGSACGYGRKRIVVLQEKIMPNKDGEVFNERRVHLGEMQDSQPGPKEENLNAFVICTL